jgi:hypothetical protein
MDAECTTEHNLMLEVRDVVGVFVGVRLVERDMLKLICTHTALCGRIGCSTLDFKMYNHSHLPLSMSLNRSPSEGMIN